jgi:hypothetical protein
LRFGLAAPVRRAKYRAAVIDPVIARAGLPVISLQKWFWRWRANAARGGR